MSEQSKSLEQWAESDRKIEARQESSIAALMEHRWKAVNEGGFSMREYARAIERNEMTVRRYVRAWPLWKEERATVSCRSASAILELAGLSEAQAEATEIVAKAKGLHPTLVRKQHAHVVRGVRVDIERHAEATGDREAAVQQVAKTVEYGEKANRQAAKNRERRRGLFSAPYFQLDGLLTRARLALRDSVRVAQESNLTNEEERELLLDHVDHLERLAGLARVALNGGDLATDWDAAAADILEGA